jgi:hypothetical protein
LATYASNRTGLLGLAYDFVEADSKKEVIRSLTSAKGVIILFAHGDRNGVYSQKARN